MRAGALVDSHAHPDPSFFGDEVEGILARAREAGVLEVVAVGTDPESSARALALARRVPGVAATAGIHPHEASRIERPGAWEDFERLARDPGFAAIGETGLDWVKRLAPEEAQRRALALQVGLARQTDRPLVLHCRGAFEDLVALLEEEGGGEVRGVFHCFAYGPEEARRALALGFHVSFSGTLTYPKSDPLREACRTVPADRLLVETDCPFLAPQPVRGRRNEPAFLRFTVERLAAERGEPFESVAGATASNARSLFRLPLP